MKKPAAVIEDFVLQSGDQEELVWLEDGSEIGLLRYFAVRAGQRTSPHLSGHLEAFRHVAIEAARYLRDSWDGRPGALPYPDEVPLAVGSLAEVPELPSELPVIFAITDPPRGDEFERLRRLARPRYTDTRVLLPAACPDLLLRLLRREGLATWTTWEVGGDWSMP